MVNMEYFLISILKVKLNLTVGTKHDRYILAFADYFTDYCVKSFSLFLVLQNQGSFLNLTNDDTSWKVNTRLLQNQ